MFLAGGFLGSFGPQNFFWGGQRGLLFWERGEFFFFEWTVEGI